MSYTSVSEAVPEIAGRLFTRARFLALVMVVAVTTVAMPPAQAQSSDAWKSAAIIAGSTAAGAYIGHKVAGPTGTWIGAGVGASVGYAIDRRRRQNQVYNQGSYDPNGGYYPDPNAGYYPDPNGGYYPDPNGGYYPNGPYDASAYPPPPPNYPGNYYSGHSSRRSSSRRAR